MIITLSSFLKRTSLDSLNQNQMVTISYTLRHSDEWCEDDNSLDSSFFLNSKQVTLTIQTRLFKHQFTYKYILIYAGVRSRRFCYARSANLVDRKRREKKTKDDDGWMMKIVETYKRVKVKIVLILRELMQVRDERYFS